MGTEEPLCRHPEELDLGSWIDESELRRQREAGGIHVSAGSREMTQEVEKPGENPRDLCRQKRGTAELWSGLFLHTSSWSSAWMSRSDSRNTKLFLTLPPKPAATSSW